MADAVRLFREGAFAGRTGRIPLCDQGTRRGIADAALFLASDHALLAVDGGPVRGDASADALSVPERAG